MTGGPRTGSPRGEGGAGRGAERGAVEGVEHVQVGLGVVVLSHLRGGRRAQPGLIADEELAVRVEGVSFDVLVEVIRDGGRGHVHRHHEPVVRERDVLRDEPVPELLVSSELLHDLEVMQLIPNAASEVTCQASIR